MNPQVKQACHPELVVPYVKVNLDYMQIYITHSKKSVRITSVASEREKWNHRLLRTKDGRLTGKRNKGERQEVNTASFTTLSTCSNHANHSADDLNGRLKRKEWVRRLHVWEKGLL